MEDNNFPYFFKDTERGGAKIDRKKITYILIQSFVIK